jgi:hypothetical protein
MIAVRQSLSVEKSITGRYADEDEGKFIVGLPTSATRPGRFATDVGEGFDYLKLIFVRGFVSLNGFYR